ncbi:hypothetical protein [Longimicrobium terrae]|uniref:Uncharacterized protein n=1 Tax=Longimicrobium terrae TaxID=1639882 RepID=A0A841H1Y6_9BACT|nr:hypothetical protein [Longimicrobium terrae]MBB4637591.1 hypothetical protein [Longimicrobium terrae]MBB6071988.1 hypothetical protein [Longimicrobium terrae]NNC29924.1 hypothetical protein [Longimicrobium terrae]
MTLAHRRVAASLAFLASAALAGVALVPDGVEYRTFGMVEGVFALLLSYLLVMRGGWAPADGVLGWIAVGYGTLASAQVLELLYPPPGMIEWMVTAGVAVTAWGAFNGGTRRRLVFTLASLALLLAVLKFSVIPVLWTRVGPAAGTGFGLGDAAEGVRRVFADYRPLRPAGQMVGFIAIAFWAVATRLLWPETIAGEVVDEAGASSRLAPPDGLSADLPRLRSVDPALPSSPDAPR